MKKKIISLCLVIALVATAIAGATLAYFTDYTDDVVNTFTFGNIDIKLDEAPVDPETGKEIDGERVIENDYEDVYPGQVLDKDPMVTVIKASEPCYVRMFVTADVAKLAAAFPNFMDGDIFDLENLVDWNKTEWPCVAVVPGTDGTATYEFRYHKIVEENNEDDTELTPLFTEVTIPGTATNEDLKALMDDEGKFAFTIYAEAIQSEGFEDAAEAWDSFVKDAQQVEPTEAPEATVETTDLPDHF